jgi:hypothetical protein
MDETFSFQPGSPLLLNVGIPAGFSPQQVWQLVSFWMELLVSSIGLHFTSSTGLEFRKMSSTAIPSFFAVVLKCIFQISLTLYGKKTVLRQLP